MKRGAPEDFIVLKSCDKQAFNVTREQAAELGTIRVALEGSVRGDFEIPRVNGKTLSLVVGCLNGCELPYPMKEAQTLELLAAANYLDYTPLFWRVAASTALLFAKLGAKKHDAWRHLLQQVGCDVMMSVFWFLPEWKLVEEMQKVLRSMLNKTKWAPLKQLVDKVYIKSDKAWIEHWAISRAVFLHMPDVVKMLLTNSRIEVCGNNWNVLKYAVRSENADIVSLFLDDGRAAVADKYGDCIEYAIALGCCEILPILFTHHALQHCNRGYDCRWVKCALEDANVDTLRVILPYIDRKRLSNNVNIKLQELNLV